MKSSCFVVIIYLFVFEKVRANCNIVKSIATCDSLNVPKEVYQSVNFLEIRNGVKEVFLPQYLFRNSNFNKLSISNGNIKRIGSDTFVDLSVSYISLRDNEIESIFAGAFRNLTRLERLRLNHNKLKVIPFGVFTKLPITTLTLSNNLITTIEDSALTELPNLKTLQLDNNKLEKVFIHKIISYPSRLEILWLHNNSLTILTNYMLEGLENLKLLNLANNQIKTVEDGTFEQTPKLNTLVLSYNKIKEIDGGVFPQQGSNYLEKLYLDNNELMYLSSNFFLKLNVLKKVTLVGNPWLCACLDIISRILYDNQIKEECQFEYDAGGQPICISEPSQTSCSYKYNNELCNKYIQARNSNKSNIRKPYCIL